MVARTSGKNPICMSPYFVVITTRSFDSCGSATHTTTARQLQSSCRRCVRLGMLRSATKTNEGDAHNLVSSQHRTLDLRLDPYSPDISEIDTCMRPKCVLKWTADHAAMRVRGSM